MDKERKGFSDLFQDLQPLILKLSGTSNYKKLRFTFEDMEGFFYEKLLYVWNKYEGNSSYEEVKAIAIASLHNYRGKIYKKYSHEVSLEEGVDIPEEIYEEPLDLLEEAKEYLTEGQHFILKLLVEPPMYVESRTNKGKRIPSGVILEFMGAPINKRSVMLMNTLRRHIFSTLEEQVNALK